MNVVTKCRVHQFSLSLTALICNSTATESKAKIFFKLIVVKEIQDIDFLITKETAFGRARCRIGRSSNSALLFI